jgi:hypothetical protein
MTRTMTEHTYYVKCIIAYFYEQGLRLLRPGGRMGYVVTNKWLKGGYAERMRGVFADEDWLYRGAGGGLYTGVGGGLYRRRRWSLYWSRWRSRIVQRHRFDRRPFCHCLDHHK